MKRTKEQKTKILSRIKELMAEDHTVDEAVKIVKISSPTYYKWKNEGKSASKETPNTDALAVSRAIDRNMKSWTKSDELRLEYLEEEVVRCKIKLADIFIASTAWGK